ncbi:MAG: hypothetical protein K2L86_08855 [Lachnospiraceae bacterium]|nr:hypothetical protein [Lachnospiraceae bacterium]
MRSRTMKKAAALALATTLCVPVFSTPAYAQGGTFETSFGVYSPKLTIQVPLKADVQINPLAKSSETGVGKFEVASNSIDIWNASVDVENDKGIPVNVTVQAQITKKGKDVITEYNTFTADKTSTVKKINLNLSEAQTAATMKAVAAGAEFDSDMRLDFTKFEADAAAVYTTPKQSVPITSYGSKLSIDIAAPTTTDTTAGATFSSDATKVSAKVGSFAVTGTANIAAAWKADDIAVTMVYDVKASEPLVITPLTAAAVAFDSANKADVTIEIKNVGEATVLGVALHDEALTPDDVIFEGAKIEYVADTTNPTQTNAKITIDKDDATLDALGKLVATKATHDIAVVLSDGRVVVTTLTVS